MLFSTMTLPGKFKLRPFLYFLFPFCLRASRTAELSQLIVEDFAWSSRVWGVEVVESHSRANYHKALFAKSRESGTQLEMSSRIERSLQRDLDDWDVCLREHQHKRNKHTMIVTSFLLPQKIDALVRDMLSNMLA